MSYLNSSAILDAVLDVDVEDVAKFEAPTVSDALSISIWRLLL